MRSVPVFFLAAALLLWLGVPAPGGSGSNPAALRDGSAASASVKKPATTKLPGHTRRSDADIPAAALCRFLDIDLGPGDLSPEDCVERYESIPSVNNNLTVQPLIVTAPDPLHTHLAMNFDRVIDTYVQAGSSAGYAWDSYWLPWGTADDVEMSDDKKREERRLEIEKRSREPGLLLFRGTYHRVLLVFVVGESPTSGIDKGQFEQAVHYIAELCTTGHCANPWSGVSITPASGTVAKAPTSRKVARGRPEVPYDVRISGPFFSGSLPSLGDAIEHLQHSHNRLRLPSSYWIVSGNTTNSEAIEAFKKRGQNLNFHFDNLAATDKASIKFLDKALADRLGSLRFGGKPVLAILSESETTYGNVKESETTYGNVKEADERSGNIRFRFPREIGRLRLAYQDSPEASSLLMGGSQIPRQSLPLVVHGQGRDRQDSVPAFANDADALSQEAVMIGLTEKLRRDRVEYVAILATDPLDSIFLGQYLSRNYPEARLVFFSSDLLLFRPSDTLNLVGSLVLYSVPALPQNSRCTGTPTDNTLPTVTFASNEERSRYVAMRYVLTADPHDKQEQPEEVLAALTLNGEARLGPVLSETTSRLFPPREPPAPLLPTSYRDVLRVSVAFGLLQSLCLLLANWRRLREVQPWLPHLLMGAERPSGVSALWRDELALGSGRLRSARVLYVSAACVITGVAIFIISAPVLSYAPVYVAFPTIFALLPTLLAVLLRSPVQDGTTDFLGPRGLVAVVWAGAATVCLIWWSAVRADTLFRERTVLWGSGVSPISPLLLLLGIFYLWAAVSARRVTLAETQRVYLPHRGFYGLLASGLSSLETEIHETLERSILDDRRYLFMFILVGAFAAFLFPWNIGSLESGKLEFTYCALISAALGVLAVAWSRFYLAWAGLRELLRRIDRLPLRQAFLALPREYAAKIWQGGHQRHSRELLVRSLECLRALGWRINEGDRDYIILHTNRLLKGEISRPARIKENALLQYKLSQIAEALVSEHLVPCWREGASVLIVKEEGKEKDTRPEWRQLSEEFLALRFLAMIHYVTAHMQNVLMLLIGGFVLLTFSLRSYPFQRHHDIGWWLMGLLLAIGVVIGTVFADMDRNPVISRVAETTEGKLSWEFASRMLSYGWLPLLTILATQFPALGKLLLSLLPSGISGVK